MAPNMHSAAHGRNNKLHTSTRDSAEGGPNAYVSVHERGRSLTSQNLRWNFGQHFWKRHKKPQRFQKM